MIDHLTPIGQLSPTPEADHRLEIVRFLELGGLPPTQVEVHYPAWSVIPDPQVRCYVESWARQVIAVPIEDKARVFALVEPAFSQFGSNERQREVEELVGFLAAAHIVKNGLFSNFDPPYPSSAAFLQDFLAKRNLSVKAPRMSKMLNSAGYWWELFALGRRVPLKLSTLEPLVSLPNRIQVYEDIMAEAGGEVPDPSQVRRHLEDLKVYAPDRRSLKPYRLSRLARDGRQLLERKPDGYLERLGEIFDQIDDCVRPKFTGRRKAKEAAVVWQPDWTEPFTLELCPNGTDVMIRIDKAHVPEAVLGAIWKRAGRAGWAELAAEAGYVAHLCDFDPAQLNSELGELEEFFGRQCQRLGAPRPRIQGEAA